MTNDKAFKNLLKNASPIQLAILRERVLKVMDITNQSIKDNPDAWNNGFIDVSIYTSLSELVNKHLGFND